MGPHAGFILAAYLVTALVLGGAIAAILLDLRSQRRVLAALSARLAERPGPVQMAERGDDDDL